MAAINFSDYLGLKHYEKAKKKCLSFERLHTTHPAWWEDLRKKLEHIFLVGSLN